MKVYTRKGDTGETSLIGGTRVKKTNVRIEAYGTVDELNSFIGLIRDTAKDKSAEEVLLEIQNLLFTIGSSLAADPGKNRMALPQVDESDIVKLENEMDSMNEGLPELKNFILPGGDLASSHCHVARCVCRRAERRAVGLSEMTMIDEKIIRYLNRLSDYLFVLARFYTHKHEGEETLWKTRG